MLQAGISLLASFSMLSSVSPTAGLATFNPDGACNDQDRQVLIEAGIHNYAQSACNGQIDFSVAGISFSTPGECDIGWAEYLGTVYSCGVQSAGNNCTAGAYKVTLNVHYGGSCPDVVGLSPGDYDSWSDVPAALREAMRCITPKVNETFDYSSAANACETGDPEPPQTSTTSLAGGGVSLRGMIDPDLIIPESGVSPFLDGYRTAQDFELSTANGLAGTAVLVHPPLEGIDFAATVRISHGGGSGPEIEEEGALTGRILENGQVSVTRVSWIEGQDPNADATRSFSTVRWNGKYLSVDYSSSEYTLAVAPTYPSFNSSFRTAMRFVTPVEEWMYNPTGLPYFSAIEYSETQVNGQSRLSRIHVSGGTVWTGTQIDFRMVDGISHPVLIRSYREDGSLVSTTSLSRYVDVGEKRFRPLMTTTTNYWDGTVEGSWTKVELDVSQITCLPIEDRSLPAPNALIKPWELWM